MNPERFLDDLRRCQLGTVSRARQAARIRSLVGWGQQVVHSLRLSHASGAGRSHGADPAVGSPRPFCSTGSCGGANARLVLAWRKPASRAGCPRCSPPRPLPARVHSCQLAWLCPARSRSPQPARRCPLIGSISRRCGSSAVLLAPSWAATPWPTFPGGSAQLWLVQASQAPTHHPAAAGHGRFCRD